MEDYDNMQTLPKDYFLREHNKEFYVQEQIYKKLRFLNELPMVQNETGEFTTYITDANPDDITGDPVTIAEGVEFNEIDFGKPSEKRGATVAKGFMFKWTDKMKRQGRLNANLQIFLTKAVGKLVNFYDKQFLNQYIAGAAATAPTGLSNWGAKTIDPIQDELLICDAMSEGGDSGFEATTVFLSRADYMARQLYLKSFNGKIENELNYVPMGSALATGDAVVVDSSIPVATVEKYADPNYSTVRKAEVAAEKAGTIDELKVPESFINIWEPEMRIPGVHEVYVWAEANVNVVEGKGIMTVKLDGS
jgi:hypothetical protein